MKRILAVGVCLAVLAPAAAMAQTYSVQQVYTKYWGPHPHHPSVGQGFCYAQGSHTHPNAIDSRISYLYRVYNGHYHFAGNVYEFGYNQAAYPYYNHHPFPASFGNAWCYLDGAHYHHFLPPQRYGASYLVHNGYYYYNGAYGSVYYTYRPRFYRTSYTYRYLPGYRRYWSRYGRWRNRYARRAAMRYIYRGPRYRGRTRYVAPGVRVYQTRPRRYARYRRAYNRPVYRYNRYRRRNYRYRSNSYRNRYRPRTTTVRRTTTTYRRGGGTYRRTSTVRRSYGGRRR